MVLGEADLKNLPFVSFKFFRVNSNSTSLIYTLRGVKGACIAILFCFLVISLGIFLKNFFMEGRLCPLLKDSDLQKIMHVSYFVSIKKKVIYVLYGICF